jgi:hypothetical protein
MADPGTVLKTGDRLAICVFGEVSCSRASSANGAAWLSRRARMAAPSGVIAAAIASTC